MFFSKENRKERRYDVTGYSIDVEIDCKLFEKLKLCNISSSGLAFERSSPLPIGEKLSITLCNEKIDCIAMHSTPIIGDFVVGCMVTSDAKSLERSISRLIDLGYIRTE